MSDSGLDFTLGLNAKGFMEALVNSSNAIAGFALKGANKFAETGGALGLLVKAAKLTRTGLEAEFKGIGVVLKGTTSAVERTVKAMHYLNGAVELVGRGVRVVENIARGGMGMLDLAGAAEEAANKIKKANGDFVDPGKTFLELKDGLLKGWQEVQTEFAKPIADALKPFMEQGIASLDTMKGIAAEVGEKLADWATYIGGAFNAGEGFDAIFLDIKIAAMESSIALGKILTEPWNKLMDKVDDTVAYVTKNLANFDPRLWGGDDLKNFKKTANEEREQGKADRRDGSADRRAGKKDYSAIDLEIAKKDREAMARRSTAANGKMEVQNLTDRENKNIQDENKRQADEDQKFREGMMDGKIDPDTRLPIQSGSSKKSSGAAAQPAGPNDDEPDHIKYFYTGGKPPPAADDGKKGKGKMAAPPEIGHALGTLRSFAQQMQHGNGAAAPAEHSKAIQRMSIQDRVKKGIPTTLQERIRAGMVKPNLSLSTHPAATKGGEKAGQNKEGALLEAVQQILQFFQKTVTTV